MAESRSFVSAIVAELVRRKVLRTVGAYAVAVFVLLQLMDAAVEPLRLPDWLPTLMVIVVILGFPLVFMLAWLFEITASGVKRTRSAGLLSRPQNAFLFTVMLLITGGLGYGFYSYYSGVFGSVGGISTSEYAAPENSIAVLPFADLSEQQDQVYLSDGVAEEILNLLAQVDGLHVAARTSSFAFRDPQKDIREIGRLLNVSTVLEGSVRTSGNQIRLTAQLINVSDGFHIWSRTFDRELDDIFSLQDEVANEIAKALVESFDGIVHTQNNQTNNLAAFEAYRTGRLHWWRRTPDELQRAIQLFAQAIEHDSGFAPAYAGMADSWLLLSGYGNLSPMEATRKAQPLIEKALGLDPQSAEAFAALGLARWQIGQNDSAESAFRQAIRLDENYIPARLWLGGLLGNLGRWPEQSMVLEEAMLLDPLNELLVVNYADNLTIRGEYQQARELLENLIQLHPDSSLLARSIAGVSINAGDLVEGWRYARQAYQLEPNNPLSITALAQTYLNMGELEMAEELLNEGRALAEDNFALGGAYYTLLLVQKRYEEASYNLTSQYGEESVAGLPDAIKGALAFQLGLLSLAQNEHGAARDNLEEAIEAMDTLAPDFQSIAMLTMASLANRRLGDELRAGQHLAEAERLLQRARLNGVKDALMDYSDACIHVMKGDLPNALLKLESAYEQGFTQIWLMDLDQRLDDLRDEPEFAILRNKIEDKINQARTIIRSEMLAGL